MRQKKRREIWKQWHRSHSYRTTSGRIIPAYQISEEHIPDDVQVEKDLMKAKKQLQREADQSKKYYSIPYVDGSLVPENLRGKGYGSALYIYAARKLASQNQTLRASGTQTKEAKKLWKNLKKYLPQNVSSVTLKFSKKDKADTFPTLDFR